MIAAAMRGAATGERMIAAAVEASAKAGAPLTESQAAAVAEAVIDAYQRPPEPTGEN